MHFGVCKRAVEVSLLGINSFIDIFEREFAAKTTLANKELEIMHHSPSEQYIKELFNDRYGVKLIKINEQHGKEGKVSDFEYIVNGRRIFICELKDFKDSKPFEDPGWKIEELPHGIVASRRHNADNRISGAIREAYKQLFKYDAPKVLTFLNYSQYLGISDFVEIYKGYRFLGFDGDTANYDVYAKRASEGKDIKDIKMKIDLYIWIDVVDRSTPITSEVSGSKIHFRYVTEVGSNIKQKYFLENHRIT